VVYVVLEKSSNTHPQLFHRVEPAQKLVAEHPSELMKSFPMPHSKHGGEVQVWRVQKSAPNASAARRQPPASPLTARNSAAQR
jgi:hypothetical protein